MKATTQAKATAQTCAGCFHTEGVAVVFTEILLFVPWRCARRGSPPRG